MFLLAVAVIVAAWVRHAKGGEVPLGYVTVVRIAGFAVGLIALMDFIFEIRHLDLDNPVDLFGAVLYYIGAALMAAGACQCVAALDRLLQGRHPTALISMTGSQQQSIVACFSTVTNG